MAIPDLSSVPSAPRRTGASEDEQVALGECWTMDQVRSRPHPDGVAQGVLVGIEVLAKGNQKWLDVDLSHGNHHVYVES